MPTTPPHTNGAKKFDGPDVLFPVSMRTAVKGVWDAASPHLGLLLATLATLAIAMRVLYVSKFDPTVALAIVQEGGAATILAMLLQTLPGAIGAIAGILAIAVLLTYLPPPPHGPRDRTITIVGGVAIIMALSVAPLSIIGLLAIIALIAIAVVIWAARSARLATSDEESPKADHVDATSAEPRVRGVGTIFVTLVASFFVGELLIATGLWLPAERFGFDGKQIVGYAVAADGDWTTILVEENRSILRVPSEEIRTRELCSLENTAIWDRPWYAIFTPDVTPPCDG
jgi:hypothetical protein